MTSTTEDASTTSPAVEPSEAVADVFAGFCGAGLWPGLGRVTAGRLADAGIHTPADISRPALAKVEGVSAARADRLVTSWAAAAPAYEVATVIAPAGLPIRWSAVLAEHFGSAAAALVRSDPWTVLTAPEATTELADRFAARLLGRPARALLGDERRGKALVAWLVARAARDGHTAVPLEVVARGLAGLDVPRPAEAVEAAIEGGAVLLAEEPTSGEDDIAEQLVALPRYAMAEEALAEGFERLAATAEPICRAEGIRPFVTGLDPAQVAAVAAVAEHGVSVLTGGPGTGKSRTVAAVVALARARNRRIALAAPTGRAAKRLEELTGEPAQTIHRLLGAQGTTGEFTRGESWPLDADVIVVDEASMLDAELAAALVEAVPDGAHVMLVGDPAQLPSIGAGRVLGDVIDAGVVPTTELTTLHRQAEGGTIARLATSVRSGELPPVSDPEREVVVVAARESGEAAHRAVQLVTDSIPRALGIPVEDVQVVTPVHRGPAGTTALNRVLKARINPGKGELNGFDVGDRVVAVANHLDDGFANGEVGVVLEIKDGVLTVAFAGSAPVVVRGSALADLRHGWAITVHRAQGSEWPAVVAVLPPEAGGMLSRPLIYTALTRAARHLSVVHAAGPAVARAVREVGARPRRTRLATLLRGDL